MSDRISYGRLQDVLPIPDLIEIQTKSYADFLQLDVPPDKREQKGFQEILQEIFPADSNENNTGLEFLRYDVEPPRVGVVDCLKDGGSYQGALYITFRLRLPNQKETKEERIHIGDLPLMTDRGSFVINGAERVIVSQLHRSPGVCFEKTDHASGKPLYSYKIIADHGSWLEVQSDAQDLMYIYVDRKHRRRKFLISTFLRAFGIKSDRELLDAVYGCHYFRANNERAGMDANGNIRIQPMFNDPEPQIGDAEKKVLDTENESNNLPYWLGVKDVSIDALLNMDADALAHVYTAEDVLDPADPKNVVIESLTSLSERVLEHAKEFGIEVIAAVDTNGMGESLIKCIQKEHKDFERMPTPEDARKEIYHKNRPSDQATDSNAKSFFSRNFEESHHYDLGRVGRFRMITRLFQSPLHDIENLFSDDEKINRVRWNRVTVPQLRNAICCFQGVLNDFSRRERKNLEDEYILRQMFFTPELACQRLMNFDGVSERTQSVATTLFAPAIKTAWRTFIAEEDGEKLQARAKCDGGEIAAFLKENLKETENLVKRACARLGVGSEADGNKEAKDDEILRKDIGEAVKSLSGAKRSALAQFAMGGALPLKKETKSTLPNARETISDALRAYLAELAKEIIAEVQDYLKSRRYLTKADIVASTAYMMRLTQGACTIDDIDHLGRRRIRTIGELVQNVCRVALARIASSFREKLQGPDSSGSAVSSHSVENISLSKYFNAKILSGQIRDFFSRNQLSQFMDQTNCLAELTNKRRLSALGPGGLTRERAGFEVRDVHASHYGRICPIETPEGPNIGLISSLALYAQIDEFGFINPPYRRVEDTKVSDNIEYLTADREENFVIAQANARQDENGKFIRENVWARTKGDFGEYPRELVSYIDVSPKQLISAAAGLIPFLEHDDANRALMGANMQRQAVPLLKAQRPIVGTGLEEAVARYSRAVVSAEEDGIVAASDAHRVITTKDGLPPEETKYPESVRTYNLYKFLRSNASTLVNQHPIVKRGDAVVKGQAIADGACTDQGELALGRNVNVAYMSWHGYNYEDAIIISEKLVSEDVYTSIHVSLEDVIARDTKLGPEEITRDIPNAATEALRNLDAEGIVRVGAEVKPDDILVGKISPKSEGDLSPEERLLRAIFGEKSQDVKDTSLKVPGGLSGIVMDVRVERKQDTTKVKGDRQDSVKLKVRETENKYRAEHDAILEEMVHALSDKLLTQKLPCPITRMVAGEPEELIAADRKITKGMLNKLASNYDSFLMRDCEQKQIIDDIVKTYRAKLRDNEQCRKEAVERIEQSEDGEVGKVRSVKVYIASKRKISVGDKMAGRNGNKGIVSKIVPIEDMPFMADGTPVDIILNPLGVPSRMNIGQVFETSVGWAARILGKVVATPSFDGVQEDKITEMLGQTREMKVREMGWTIDQDNHVRDKDGKIRDDYFVGEDGKVRLFDGRTGDPFDQRIMVGTTYMLKLDHLVANKIHARAVGNYSLVTQQPLGGKAQRGGQRFGEMEVWALEAYGAAYTLQEMLTVKSDDKNGRTRLYDAIMRGDNTLHAGIPESFNVLMREMMSLCLNVQLRRQKTLAE
ncbi:MAG: DNA-directed RNA polymerase subunit beta [Victivallales bacterium]|nr:DNA-directed RNA polymerase subunit beta [Victivallales bacterium]